MDTTRKPPTPKKKAPGNESPIAVAIGHGRTPRLGIQAISFDDLQPPEPRKYIIDVWIDGKGKQQCVNILPIGFPGYSRKEPYWIAIDRIDTPTKLLGWIAHLVEKTWMDAKGIYDLVELVRGRFGWDIHNA